MIEKLKKHYTNHKQVFFLIIILIFALFLRVYALGSPAFWIDESISSTASKMILQKGLPIFDSGAFYSRALVFHYLQSFCLLFNSTEFNARFISVIFGLLTIVLAYFIGKEYSKSGGILSALFVAIFYLEVFFSRQARFYQLFQLMFFLSIYLLYKSKENPKYIYLALIALVITINTQLAGIVLIPFFIIYMIFFLKQKKYTYLSIIPLGFLVYKAISVFGMTSNFLPRITLYINRYFSYASNMYYLLILFIPGIIWAFYKKKKLTALILLPSFILLFGVFFIRVFAFRYIYFFVFPLILFSSLLMSFLYEKYGKIMLISIFFLILLPSNLFFPYTYVNVISPIKYNYNDFSAPEINYLTIPSNLSEILKQDKTIIFTLFSPSIEWHIKKPDYAFPFSMNGIGKDTISYNNSNNQRVDVYSGAPISTERPNQSFYFILDYFSAIKLKPDQREQLQKILENCTISYENKDLQIYDCPQNYQ